MVAEVKLAQERLKHLLHYDPITGVFTWKVTTGPKALSGTRAGTTRGKGYRSISVDIDRYYEHRLAWFYVHGKWPDNRIDHINGDRADNRISNLRDVSTSINNQNRKAAQSNSKSGMLGVKTTGRAWQARICTAGKQKHLGTFSTPQEAHEAYLESKRKVHEGCTI